MQLLVLNAKPDPADPATGIVPINGIDAFSLYDRFYEQNRVMHDSLSQIGCHDLASIVNITLFDPVYSCLSVMSV